MIIIVGLGNPGKQYKNTRHNLGFLALDFFARKYRFPKFKMKRSCLAEITTKKIEGKEIVLMKPQTFMNLSGKAVKLFSKKYKINPDHFWIVHDDLAIPFEKIKISFGKGAAGHKGIQSILEEFNQNNFLRFRIGIKPEGVLISGFKKDVFVLKNFEKKEGAAIKKIIKKTVEAIELTIKKGKEKAMNFYNKD